MKPLLSGRGLVLLGNSAFLMPLLFFTQPSAALVPTTTAVITNSGSTNTIGYRAFVAPSGIVNYDTGKGPGQGRLPTSLTAKFFRDIKAAMPLAQLPVKRGCIKSVSFGASTFVVLGVERSPDVSCPGNAKAQTLESDVNLIVKALSVGNVPWSQGKELPPQNF
jgi:hypothetical protein